MRKQFIPATRQIVSPNCAKCGARMWLVQIEPDKPDHDRRTFECVECDTVTVEVVKYC